MFYTTTYINNYYPGVTPCAVQEKTHLLGGPMSCSWWQIPIHSGPLLKTNCPHPYFQTPPHPPTPLACSTYITTTTSTISVFLIQNIYIENIFWFSTRDTTYTTRVLWTLQTFITNYIYMEYMPLNIHHLLYHHGMLYYYRLYM
jgi:hypothetical protein